MKIHRKTRLENSRGILKAARRRSHAIAKSKPRVHQTPSVPLKRTAAVKIRKIAHSIPESKAERFVNTLETLSKSKRKSLIDTVESQIESDYLVDRKGLAKQYNIERIEIADLIADLTKF